MYVDEAARLKAEFGLEGATAFLERLRDNLIEIRPLPVKEPGRPGPKEAPASDDWDDLPDRYMLVDFDAEVEVETDMAMKIGETWVPKSQMLEEPAVGDYVSQWPVTKWFAEKEGL